MFVVTIESDDGEWFGTTIIDYNADGIDKHAKLTTDAERLGFKWSSVRPDSYDDLMQNVRGHGHRLLDLYKIVVRDSNGKVMSHERYRANVEKVVLDETALGHVVTVTRLTGGTP